MASSIHRLMTMIPTILMMVVLYITVVNAWMMPHARAAPRLFALYPKGLGIINIKDASITPGPDVDFDLELLVTVMTDPARGLYILHGFVDDTNQGIQVININTGATVARCQLPYAIDSVYYDPALGRYFALDFSGILEVNIATGAFSTVYAFNPPFDVIDEDSTAYDMIKHRITFMNTTSVIDTLATVDVVTRSVVANVDLQPRPTQQIAPMMFTPTPPQGFVWGWAEHNFSKLNTTTGAVTTLMPTIYTPFDTLSTAVDPSGSLLSFVGTDGKQHCFVVTLDISKQPWNVLYEPLTTPDLESLPSGLAYFP